MLLLSVTVQDSHGSSRTVADLPEIKPLGIGMYRDCPSLNGYLNRMHELRQAYREIPQAYMIAYHIYEKQLYGPMYKVNAGNFQAISVNSVDLLEELLRKDEKFPSRGDMTLWTEYRDMKDIGYGPFTE
ncbi:hypothetical protein cypCar_00009914 [Cyprinus carpio]|nr:hypothetical protein cypCar_00009914 [Cyprinus carpio]